MLPAKRHHPTDEPEPNASNSKARRMSAEGKRFEDERFSDATVKCGNREWRVHRVILCNASSFFEKALSGSFAEAVKQEVTIEEFDEGQVELALRWIYDNADPISDMDNTTSEYIPNLIGLYRIADYLDIKMREHILAALETYFNLLAARVQARYAKSVANHRDKLRIDLLDDAELEGVMNGAATVFAWGFDRQDPLQVAFATLVHATCWLLLSDRRFIRRLADVAHFGVAILQTRFTRGGWVETRLLPLACTDCARTARDILSDEAVKTGSRWGKIWFRNTTLGGKCNKCVDLEAEKRKAREKAKAAGAGGTAAEAVTATGSAPGTVDTTAEA